MKIAAALYLSNQQVIGYPIEHVLRSLECPGGPDVVYLFGGDDENVAALRHFTLSPRTFPTHVDRLDPANDVHITTPGDIPRMMGMCVDRLRDEADFVLLTQADTLATPESMRVVREFCVEANRKRAAHTYCRIAFLYQDSSTGWGHTIVGNDFRGEFIGDGEANDDGGHRIGFIGGWPEAGRPGTTTTSVPRILDGCLEIGSLSPELYYRHQSQHVRTWNENWLMGDRLAAYRAGHRDEFLRLSLHDARHRIIGRPLEPIEQHDPRFTAVIDAMGLRHDCEHVCALIKRYGFDR